MTHQKDMSVLTHLHLEMSYFHISTKEKQVCNGFYVILHIWPHGNGKRVHVVLFFTLSACPYKCMSWNAVSPHMHTVKVILANHRMSILIESDLSWRRWPSYKPSPFPKWMSSYRPINLALTPNSIWIMHSSIWKDLWQIFKVCMQSTYKEYWTCTPTLGAKMSI